MKDYLTPTAILHHRREETLTPDERSSLEYLMACIDDMDRLRRRSPAHRWTRTAQQMEDIARRVGDLAAAEGELSTAQRRWIEAQKTGPVNSFQRDRLEAIPGWIW